MSDTTNGDGLPRLPPVGPSSPQGSSDTWLTIRSPADLGAVDQNRASIRRMTWAEYAEPELRDLRLAGRVLLGTRVALTLWSIALVAAAAVLRAEVEDDIVSTANVSRLGALGLLVALVAAVAGWYWADRATQNVHRLEARLPSRLRCVSGWAWPLVWVIVLSITVLRLDATELVDVRPALVGLVFAAALWRPYALVRRILKSLIRVDSDLAITSAFVLDLAMFGLVWARLASLPSELGPTDGGVAGILVGLSAVAAVAAVANVGVWHVIVRDVSRGVDHRQIAMRTRHEHRQLRLVGIDPLDPKVRFALLMIQQEDHRAEIVRARQGADAHTGTTAVGREEHVVPERAASMPRPAEAIRPGGRGDLQPASASVSATDHEDHRLFVDVSVSAGESVVDAATVDAAAHGGEVAPIRAGPSGFDDPRVDPAGVTAVAAGDAAALPVDDPADGSRAGARDPGARLAARLRADQRVPGPVPTGGESHPIPGLASAPDRTVGDGAPVAGAVRASAGESLRDRLAARADVARGDAPRGRLDRLDRLSGRLGGASSGVGDGSPRDPLDRLSERLGGEVFSDDRGRSMLNRLERFGIAPRDESIPDERTSRTRDDTTEVPQLTIERLYSLELARYLLVLAIVVSAGAAAWFLIRSVDMGDLIGGAIAPSDRDRLDIARLITARALAVALAVVPAWCAVAARWANRVDIDVRGTVRCAALTVVSAGFVVAGFVADPTTDVMLFTMLGCLGAALWAVPVMIEVERRFGRGTTIPSLLPLVLALGVVVAWAGRLLRPVAATDSPEAMSFFGGLLALVMAIAAVVTTVSTGDVVEAIKLSPAAPGRASAASTDDDRASPSPV